MSNWITATGEVEAPTSNLDDTSITTSPQVVVGNRNNIEVTGNGPVTANAPAEHTLGQDMPSNAGVMATARNHSGGGIYGRNPTGKDIVNIGGMETHIDNAVRMGLVVRNSDGTFSDAPPKVELKDPTEKAVKAVKAPLEAAEKTDPDSVSFGKAGDEAMQELLDTQMPSNLYKTVDSILYNGELDERTLERMASEANIEPHQMAEKLTTVWAGVHDAATDALYDAGIGDEDAFAAFIASNPQNQQNMMEAARNFFVYHNPEGLNTMAEAYLPQMDKFDAQGVREMLTAAGYEYADKPDGGLFVVVQGMKMSWEVAVKQKAITFSKA